MGVAIASLTLNGQILINENIINPKASAKIDEIGAEVLAKTKINIYLIAVNSLGGKKIKDYEKEKSTELKKPYILLTLSKNDKQVDIISSPLATDKFDKEDVLDPTGGTIIPILVTKVKKDLKVDDKHSAAMLNGYADIAEQVADSFDIELKSGLGNTNRNLINLIRLFVYGSILLLFLMYLKRKIFGKSKEK